jgi:hypothetical protein
MEQVVVATAEWVDWWNHRRLPAPRTTLLPTEFEQRYHDQRAAVAVA